MFNSTNLCVADDSWWQLLGPAGNGHAKAADLPVRWTEQQNVAWKTAIHDRDWSSPVIHGNQIWLTTATADGHKLYAVYIDKNTGRILHDRHVFDVAEPQKVSDQNTYATPTPVIEQGRVFVHFGTYGTACLDTQTGETIWSRRDLNCDHEANAGPASSPTIIAGKLVVHVDGRDVQYIIGLDTTTGETVWKTSRSYDYSEIPVHQRKAYGMPGIAPRGDAIQMISSVGQGVYAYDVAGRELWRVRHKGWSIAPRPVAGHGLVFVIVDHDHPELWAIRHDGSGDVTESHIVWKETRSMSERCTPLLVDDLIYVVNRDGLITCLEAKTGDLVWKERLDGKYSASPIYAQDRIYLFSEHATCTIIRPGREFDVVAVNSLASQSIRATPAVDGNALIVRTADSLFRIEAATENSRPSSANVDDSTLTLPLVGYNEHRTNLPGGRQANVSTNRAMIVQADGSGRREIGGELVNEPGVWTQFAGWSPDGKMAVVLRGWESVENAQWEEEHKSFRFTPEGWLIDSFLMDVATGRAENVTAVDRVSFYNTGLFFWPNDPNKLGFTALIDGNSKPFRMDRDGRNKTDLTKASSGFAYGFSSSPDGSRISYHENYQVYLANADGSNRIHVQTGHPFDFVPSWSPDGKWVMFVSGEHYNCHPHIVKADGTGLKKLADRGGYRGVTEFLDVPDYHGGSSDIPVWSVDGQSVFYTAQVGNNVELFQVTLDGQSERLTTSADGTSHYHPKPSPDGQWIVYGSKRNGVRNLFVMRLSNRKEHALTDVPAGHAAMHAYWQPTEWTKVK